MKTSTLLAVLLTVATCGGQTPPALTPLKVVDGIEGPTMVTSARDGSGRLYVVEQPGRIRIVRDGKLIDRPFLDIQSRVLRSPNEQGLLERCLPPRLREQTVLLRGLHGSAERYM